MIWGVGEMCYVDYFYSGRIAGVSLYMKQDYRLRSGSPA